MTARPPLDPAGPLDPTSFTGTPLPVTRAAYTALLAQRDGEQGAFDRRWAERLTPFARFVEADRLRARASTTRRSRLAEQGPVEAARSALASAQDRLWCLRLEDAEWEQAAAAFLAAGRAYRALVRPVAREDGQGELVWEEDE